MGKGATMLHYETEDNLYPDPVTDRRYGVIAVHILGWETQPDEDTAWSGYEARTGWLVAVMVGDDHKYLIDPEDIEPLDATAYCRDCGQIGCTSNVSD